jgi:hypothetical protein
MAHCTEHFSTKHVHCVSKRSFSACTSINVPFMAPAWPSSCGSRGTGSRCALCKLPHASAILSPFFPYVRAALASWSLVAVSPRNDWRKCIWNWSWNNAGNVRLCGSIWHQQGQEGDSNFSWGSEIWPLLGFSIHRSCTPTNFASFYEPRRFRCTYLGAGPSAFGSGSVPGRELHFRVWNRSVHAARICIISWHQLTRIEETSPALSSRPAPCHTGTACIVSHLLAFAVFRFRAGFASHTTAYTV